MLYAAWVGTGEDNIYQGDKEYSGEEQSILA